MHKCNKCPKPATYHVTEVVTDEQYEELHLCEDCYHELFKEGLASEKSEPSAAVEDSDDASALNARECPVCGIKFVEFRNVGRLGCPHDYVEFREELIPLLESIHGELKHVGKVPRRQPQNRQRQSELVQLRKQLQQAIQREAYEDAARLRDRIKTLEES